jgi:hypothetical protein
VNPTPDELHSMLWQAIEKYGNQECGLEECPGVDLSPGAQTLFQIVFRHRPEPIPTYPDGKKAYPGWTQVCAECQRRYPCSTVADVADGFDVDWVQRLVP